MTQLVLNEQHYEAVLKELIPSARKFVWILTADIKDAFMEGTGGRFIPVLGVLAEKLREGVEVRLIHAKEPGPRFRQEFDRFPEFLSSDNFDRLLCPRQHMKVILVDGKRAYVGSANLTGAGVGAKGANRRNFEAGVLTDDPQLLEPLMNFCDAFYAGELCRKCDRREYCPNPLA
jgi:phosphatidylserine/phosphatidylglycerophosphate/cardiolipin synthase-like enzyme